MRKFTALIVPAAALLVAASAHAAAISIFEGLASGKVWAEFRGNGDSSVLAIIGKNDPSITEVTIPAGSRFQVAQLAPGGFGGFGGRGGLRQFGGGRQGMFGARTTTGMLAFAPAVTLTIPAVCGNWNLPAPTRRDILVILPPSGPEAALVAAAQRTRASHPALQIAMWAVANNAPARAAAEYLADLIPGPQFESQRLEILRSAAALLRTLGLNPHSFRIFSLLTRTQPASQAPEASPN